MKILIILLIFICLNLRAETLTEVIQYTLNSNPEVLTTTSDQRASRHELRQAEAGYLPSVDLNVDYGREHSDNPNTRARYPDAGGNDLNRRELGLTLSQRLFDGFEVKNQVKRQEAKVSAATYQVQTVRESIGLEVAGAYLEVLHRQELLELAKSNLVIHQKLLEQIRIVVEGGAGRKADLQQSESRLALAKATLVKTHGDMRDAEVSYQRVVGKLPNALETLSRELVVKALTLPDSLEAVLETAVHQHPSLHVSTAELESAKAYHEQTDASFMPRLNFVLSATDNDNLEGVEGANDDISAMLALRYNLYRGGADQAKRQETAEQVTKAKESLNETERGIVETAQLAWNSLITSRDRLNHLESYVESTEKVLVSYKEQFKLGQRSLLDVLDSENELFNARSLLTTARYVELLALFRVAASMGLLLERLGVSQPK